jgi:hypothetical protein
LGEKMPPVHTDGRQGDADGWGKSNENMINAEVR